MDEAEQTLLEAASAALGETSVALDDAAEVVEQLEAAEDGQGELTWRSATLRTSDWLNPLLGTASGPFEAVATVAAFEPSLMPRTSVHQGIAAGVSALGARTLGTGLEQVMKAILPRRAGLPLKLTARAVVGGLGITMANLPDRDDRGLWRAGSKSAGQVLAAVSASGALYDVSTELKMRYRRGRTAQPILSTLGISAAFAIWAKRTLAHRKSVVPRWPIEQKNEFPMALGVGYAVYAVGAGLGKAYVGSRKAMVGYLGPGPSKRVIGGIANAALWTAGAVTAYNAGVGYIGRANENIEPAYALPPVSPLVSGSEHSVSTFGDLGLQGRRYVTDVTSKALIEEVMGEPATAAPIRVYVGYNSEPLYPMGRTEIAMRELERTGAFERSHLLLVSPTGTGWVDQTMIESAEFLTRGDIATCVIQYGRFPSFLAVQKVALGRQQFRALLWSIRNRLAGMAEDQRPKVYVFGESLGAWASSDVIMYQGVDGFDHYGIDKALWVGLPGLAKWSRNGMASGRSDLVPEGTVAVFDHPSEMKLTAAERRRLRATVLSHHSDPIAVMSLDVMIDEPEWLSGERGRNVPDDMEWFPFGTFLQVGIDAMNAMVMVPGEFGSFGHDYRADMAAAVATAYNLPATVTQLKSVVESLVTLELERADRITAAKAEDAPAPPDYRGTHLEDASTGKLRVEAGVPLQGKRTSGAQWLKGMLGEDKSADIL
ncbi:MAG: hypothetical protein BMS9Abin07_0822 [Acidimicrobiia bacterium]|nr:MAG: hypothetical protein BMS9Abin07_0822 [Acidimicrobiia bacterium]